MITMTLPINPEPKLRPRFSKCGRVYTPQKTEIFERCVKLLSLPYKPKDLLTGPLDIDIVFYLRPPKSKKNKFPIVKPDVDNFAKAILDSLNGIFWKDDSQVCTLTAKKIYDWNTKDGYIEISISQINQALEEG